MVAGSGLQDRKLESLPYLSPDCPNTRAFIKYIVFEIKRAKQLEVAAHLFAKSGPGNVLRMYFEDNLASLGWTDCLSIPAMCCTILQQKAGAGG